MLQIEIKNLLPSATELNGATMGEAHALEMRQRVMASSSETRVVLDFSGIVSASASYMKRVLNPFFLPVGELEGFRHEITPIVSNIQSQDLREDIEAYLVSSERVLVLGKEIGGDIGYVDLLGRLDGAAAETFTELCSFGTVSAAQLYERYKKRTTNQTAWNNRLAKLVEMRIARRYREGRIWMYQPSLTT